MSIPKLKQQVFAFIVVAALFAGVLIARSRFAHSGFPLTHKWRQTNLCVQYAKKSGISLICNDLSLDSTD
jgi:hypothetical protein